MQNRHTTAMEGGSADYAGAIICPYILYISPAIYNGFARLKRLCKKPSLGCAGRKPNPLNPPYQGDLSLNSPLIRGARGVRNDKYWVSCTVSEATLPTIIPTGHKCKGRYLYLHINCPAFYENECETSFRCSSLSNPLPLCKISWAWATPSAMESAKSPA